jgi:tRNA(fMet)-specific endonuclease VapC
MLVFDTDHMTHMEHARSSKGQRIHARLSQTNEDRAVTIITYEEQMRGWLGYAAKARTLLKQVDAYRQLRRHVEMYKLLKVLDFDERAAAEFQNLQRGKTGVGPMDLKIAAIVIVQGATLLSCNLRDFGKVSGLRVEDWTR